MQPNTHHVTHTLHHDAYDRRNALWLSGQFVTVTVCRCGPSGTNIAIWSPLEGPLCYVRAEGGCRILGACMPQNPQRGRRSLEGGAGGKAGVPGGSREGGRGHQTYFKNISAWLIILRHEL